MGGLILGVNTLYRLFCLFKLFPLVSKGLRSQTQLLRTLRVVAAMQDTVLVAWELER